MAATIPPNRKSPASRTLEALIREWIPSYDTIFSTRLDPSVRIQDSKNRDLDEGYRQAVASAILESYSFFGVKTADLRSETITCINDQIDALLLNRK